VFHLNKKFYRLCLNSVPLRQRGHWYLLQQEVSKSACH
jgi:hypothetical protein